MKTLQKYIRKWESFAGPLNGGTLAVIFLCVLLMWSCSGTKQFTDNKTHTLDSVTEKVVIAQKPITIPLTQAALRLNLADVQNLTPGAVFTERSGQASVRVERKDSIIVVTAQCDSLQLLVETQIREIYHLRTQLEQQHTEIEKPPSGWEALKNNVFYIAIGMGLMLIVIYIKRIWQRIQKPVRML